MLFKYDPYNLNTNLQAIENQTITWNYDGKDTANEEPKSIGYTKFTKFLNSYNDIVQNMLKDLSMKCVEYKTIYPSLQDLDTEEFNSDKVLLSWQNNISGKKHMVINKSSLKNFIKYCTKLSLIDLKYPLSIAEYSGVESYNILGFFNKDFAPVFIKWQGKENLFGYYDYVTSEVIENTNVAVKYTAGKMYSWLKASQFKGVINFKLHVTENNIILLEDISTYLPDLVMYDVLQRTNATNNIDNFFKLFKAIVRGSDVINFSNIEFKENKNAITRITLPPYPIVKPFWVRNKDLDILFNAPAKGFTFTPSGNIYWRDVKDIGFNQFETNGILVGAMVEDMGHTINSCAGELFEIPGLQIHYPAKPSLFQEVKNKEAI